MKKYKYHIAISYATEQVEYAKKLKNELINLGLSVFLDLDNQSRFWGTYIPDELRKVYMEESKQIVILLSKEYLSKDYPKFEAHIASERALAGERICIIKMDNVSIPWLNKTIGYKNASDYSIAELALMLKEITQKKTNNNKIHTIFIINF